MIQEVDLVVRGTVVTEHGQCTAAVAIAGGKIQGIGGIDAPFIGKVDRSLSDDEVLVPGIVDTHVHVNEPGRTEWEGFASATRAAAAGGVTTIVDMPLNSIPATLDVAALSRKRQVAADQSSVDVGFWGGAVPGNLGTLRELHAAGVFGVKCFLSPSGVDEFPHLTGDDLVRALAEVASYGGLLIAHAEDPAVLASHTNAGGTAYSEFVRSRPPAAETVAVARVIDGLRRSGGRAHIVHVSSAQVLPLLREAKQEGLHLTAETCPHYLTMVEEEIPDAGTQFKCCPPIRDERNREELWGGLLDGTLDCIVTDHSPSTAALKFGHGRDFGLAWGGIAGLQVGLAAVWTEADRRGIPLSSVIRWMSAAPARLVRLSDKGRLEIGADADLVVFAPEARFTVDVAELLHKNQVSAYDGRSMKGVVRDTILRGKTIDLDGPPQGTLLRLA